MKSALAISLLLAMLSILDAQLLSPDIVRIERAAQSASPGLPQVLQNTRSDIKLYLDGKGFFAAESRKLGDVRSALDRVRQLIVAAANDSNPEVRYEATHLLAYVHPDQAVADALYRLKDDSNNRANALTVIFRSGLDNPDLRREVADWLNLSKRSDGSYDDRRSIVLENAGSWKLNEAVPALTRIVTESNAEGELKEAARQLGWLGPAAQDALPTLRRRLAEMKSQRNADFRVIEALQSAISQIEKDSAKSDPDPADPRLPHPRLPQLHSLLTGGKSPVATPAISSEASAPASNHHLLALGTS